MHLKWGKRSLALNTPRCQRRNLKWERERERERERNNKNRNLVTKRLGKQSYNIDTQKGVKGVYKQTNIHTGDK